MIISPKPDPKQQKNNVKRNRALEQSIKKITHARMAKERQAKLDQGVRSGPQTRSMSAKK